MFALPSQSGHWSHNSAQTKRRGLPRVYLDFVQIGTGSEVAFKLLPLHSHLDHLIAQHYNVLNATKLRWARKALVNGSFIFDLMISEPLREGHGRDNGASVR